MKNREFLTSYELLEIAALNFNKIINGTDVQNSTINYKNAIETLYSIITPQSNAKVIADFEILPPPNKSVVDLAEEFVFDRMD